MSREHKNDIIFVAHWSQLNVFGAWMTTNTYRQRDSSHPASVHPWGDLNSVHADDEALN